MANSKTLEDLRLVADMQQSEARLHWRRNSYFLLVSSILLVALSQFNVQAFQLLLSILGFLLNVAWLLIQHRSSLYIQHWKTIAQKLQASTDLPEVYPKRLGGVEMRIVAYTLPVMFIVIWGLIIGLLACSCPSSG